jgi:DNA-binding transcriptional LysR family regulator
MDLQALTLLADVARLGSFAAVARARGWDPSAVSRSIAALEADLGLRLFQRTTRRLALTEAGDLYLTRALPLLEELQRIGDQARAAQTVPRGLLRLTASVTFGQAILMPLLPAFRARCPEVGLECLFTDQNLDLTQDRIDLAVRLGPAVEGDVIASRLMTTRYRVVASPAYLAGSPALDGPADLARHRLLLFTIRPFRSRWLFRDAAGTVHEQPVAGDVAVSPAGAILDAALAGMGVALLPDYLTDPRIAEGRLAHLLPQWDVAATTFDTGAWLVYPSRAFVPAKTRAMIDFLREHLPQGRVAAKPAR